MNMVGGLVLLDEIDRAAEVDTMFLPCFASCRKNTQDTLYAPFMHFCSDFSPISFWRYSPSEIKSIVDERRNTSTRHRRNWGKENGIWRAGSSLSKCE